MALFAAATVSADTIDYARVMQDIARDIGALKPDYPQLAGFTAATASGDALKISYGFHTHQAAASGGWSSGVPNPDNDGVWFYIDFHDPDSTAQIHTQPMSAVQCLGDKRVSFLILEGDATKRLEAEIEKILRDHGVGRCVRPQRGSGVNARIS
jgi:hypothetical protein